MSTLVKYGLVEAHHDTTSYSLHTCVHDWTLNGLNHEINESSYWLAFARVTNQICVGDFGNEVVLCLRLKING